jgi:hypothetical protein
MMSGMATSIRDLRLSATGLIRRHKAGWLPVEGRNDLVSVPEEEGKEMVDVLVMDTHEYVENREIDEGAARALSMGFRLVTRREPPSEGTMAAAYSAARLGYVARMVEWDTVVTALRPKSWMIAGLRGAVESNVAEELEDAEDPERSFHDVLAEITAFFVRREPIDVPYDAKQGFALMWTIPGTGGEVRALVRDKTLEKVLQRDGKDGRVDGATLEDLQRVWKYGFLLRSFEEFFWED